MSSEGPTPPARPHHRFTEDGRRIREVLSYSRRGNRFTPHQQDAWAAHHQEWVIPDDAVDEPGFRLADSFGWDVPTWDSLTKRAPAMLEGGYALGAIRKR